METLVGLALVLIAAVALGRTLHQTVRCGKTGILRLQHDQEAVSWRNRLLSSEFNNADLSNGIHEGKAGKWHLQWQVDGISSGLKRIRLTVASGPFTTRRIFHKSIYIHDSAGASMLPSVSGRRQ